MNFNDTKSCNIQPEENKTDSEKTAVDQEERYASCLSSLLDLHKEFDTLKNKSETCIKDLKLKYELKQQEEKEKNDEFIKYKRQIALTSVNTRTGKLMSSKVI